MSESRPILRLVQGGKQTINPPPESTTRVSSKAGPRRPFDFGGDPFDPPPAKAQTKKKKSKIRDRSGQVDSFDPMVQFLYLLARDYLVPGKIEDIMLEVEPGKTEFSNGWLASYAQDLAQRLRS